MEESRSVSTTAVWAWGLWIAAIVVCLVGTVVVLAWGTDLWARAVGLSLFGVEVLLVAAACTLTARIIMRRHTRRLEARIDGSDRDTPPHGVSRVR